MRLLGRQLGLDLDLHDAGGLPSEPARLPGDLRRALALHLWRPALRLPASGKSLDLRLIGAPRLGIS